MEIGMNWKNSERMVSLTKFSGKTEKNLKKSEFFCSRERNFGRFPFFSLLEKKFHTRNNCSLSQFWNFV